MDQQDVERIARKALKELGVDAAERATVTLDDPSGHWLVQYDSHGASGQLRIKCGSGTTAQWVREQIFAQYLAQN